MSRKSTSRVLNIGPDGLWHALPGEVSERMWGMDYVVPGDTFLTDQLVHPLGLNNAKSLLDLSAGLGGRLHRIAEEYHMHVEGLEADATIAVRGMELLTSNGLGSRAKIAPFDPLNLKTERTYDYVIAREIIYRNPDKDKFVRSIVGCLKPKGQISFTDYVINAEYVDAPAIIAWREMEPGAEPVGLVEMAELWAKAGVSLRVHDDQTDYYKKEVMAGLATFAKFMASGVKPDADTKKIIDKRITTWAHRIAAINAGMKFYRFYGTR